MPVDMARAELAFTPAGGVVVVGSASNPDRGVVLLHDGVSWTELDTSGAVVPFMVRVSPAGDQVTVRTFAIDTAVLSVELP